MGFGSFFHKLSSGARNIFHKVDHGASNFFHKTLPSVTKSVVDTINNASNSGSVVARKIGNTLEKVGNIAAVVGGAFGNPSIRNLGTVASLAGSSFKALRPNINQLGNVGTNRISSFSNSLQNAYK
jgi:hypothetical protein